MKIKTQVLHSAKWRPLIFKPWATNPPEIWTRREFFNDRHVFSQKTLRFIHPTFFVVLIKINLKNLFFFSFHLKFNTTILCFWVIFFYNLWYFILSIYQPIHATLFAEYCPPSPPKLCVPLIISSPNSSNLEIFLQFATLDINLILFPLIKPPPPSDQFSVIF